MSSAKWGSQTYFGQMPNPTSSYNVEMLFYICIAVILNSWRQTLASLHTGQLPLSLSPISDPDLPGQTRLNFSSPSPHLFSSLHGLLRQGYNTFFSNGHVVAPCQIPPYTPLYHGWLKDEPPQSPEWLAFTPYAPRLQQQTLKDMAYGIMGSTRNSFLSTYQTTRSINCLYFDGASGALGENGTMDAQMLLIYGNITGPPATNSTGAFLWDEYSRAQRLCAWIHQQNAGGLGYGIEGIVRMSAGFELIWCNFSSPSLKFMSRVNVTVPLLGYNRTSTTSQMPGKIYASSPTIALMSSTDLPAPEWEIDWEHEPFIASQQWDWLTSASRFYSVEDLASQREPSLRVLDGDCVNLYSSEYLSSVGTIREQEQLQLNLTSDGHWKGVESRQERKAALEKLMRRRTKHRVGNLSQSDLTRFHQSLTRILSKLSQSTNNDSHGSDLGRNIPWSYICDLIVNNYSKRLAQFQRLFDLDDDAWTGSGTAARKQFMLIRERSHALLMPFAEHPVDPDKKYHSAQQASRIKEQALDRCKYMYLPKETAHTSSQEDESAPLYRLQHPFGQAIEEVTAAICSALIFIGYSVEKEWSQSFNSGKVKDDGWKNPLRAKLLAWQEKIEELTAWLGWAPHWLGCDRLCDWDEECYIPIWPVVRQLRIEKPAYPNFPPDPEDIEYDLWHPRCLKVSDFLSSSPR